MSFMQVANIFHLYFICNICLLFVCLELTSEEGLLGHTGKNMAEETENGSEGLEFLFSTCQALFWVLLDHFLICSLRHVLEDFSLPETHMACMF